MGFTKEMFSPPRNTRKVLDENSEIIGSSHFNGTATKSSNHDIASPSRDASSDGRFQFPSKIRALPTIWKELELTGDAYQHLKGEYHVLGLCVSATEMLVRFWSSVVLFVAFSPPLSDATGRLLDKFRILDEWSCHQLDFLEEQMTKNEYGSIYKTGGLAERLERLVRLFFRIVFICPRLGVRMFNACVNCVGDEIAENVELLSNVVDPPTKARASARLSKSKSLKKSQVGEKSPGKKRKIAEVTEEESAELPYYFEEQVHYVEEEDTDFDPNLDDAEEDSEDDIDTQEEDTQEEDTQEEDDEEEDEDDEPVVESSRDEVDENENKVAEELVEKKKDALLSLAIACPLPETPTL